MPLEIKNIYFNEKEVRTALVNFSILNHEYLDVDLNVIWSALTQNLIPLKVVLLEIKRDMNNAKRL